MHPLALSPLEVLVGIGLAIAGFIVVALVCAAVLAVLQVVLPSTDSGAAAIDGADSAADVQDAEEPEAVRLDSEADV